MQSLPKTPLKTGRHVHCSSESYDLLAARIEQSLDPTLVINFAIDSMHFVGNITVHAFELSRVHDLPHISETDMLLCENFKKG